MIESYSESKVILTPAGELCIALPIYANQNGVLFSAKDIKKTIDKKAPDNMSIGVFEKMGFLIYHPDHPVSFYMKSVDLFDDLGEL